MNALDPLDARALRRWRRPSGRAASRRAEGQLLANQPAPKFDAPLPIAGELDARSTASCSAYRNVTYLRYDYECANGAVGNGPRGCIEVSESAQGTRPARLVMPT
jgi:hypothetical protein